MWHYVSFSISRVASRNRISRTRSWLQGNAHFREGEYRKAIAEYEGAIKIHGPTPAYLSNMAAAWLKLEE